MTRIMPSFEDNQPRLENLLTVISWVGDKSYQFVKVDLFETWQACTANYSSRVWSKQWRWRWYIDGRWTQQSSWIWQQRDLKTDVIWSRLNAVADLQNASANLFNTKTLRRQCCLTQRPSNSCYKVLQYPSTAVHIIVFRMESLIESNVDNLFLRLVKSASDQVVPVVVHVMSVDIQQRLQHVDAHVVPHLHTIHQLHRPDLLSKKHLNSN